MISEDKINIIKHCRKSKLYHNVELWIKKGVSSNFDNLIGSFDGAQLFEFIGCLLLNFNSIIDPCNHGLHGDDGLIIVDNCTPRNCDIIKKEIASVVQ